MREYLKFYINGQWVDPASDDKIAVENPATEAVCGHIAAGTAADVDAAVTAARKAFPSWSRTSREERLAVFERIMNEYEKRIPDIAAAISEEMGAPAALAGGFQVGLGSGHLATAMEVLRNFVFEEQKGASLIVKEPIGVCGLITPWNWPINQIAVKVFPALATGCTMILKPSEISPFSAQLFAEVLHAAGVPAGVFNFVQGTGPDVGAAMSAHPDIDMISFTGSTRAGVEIARSAAPTVKRVAQELGGKSANIVLDDDAFAQSVAAGVGSIMTNSGQTCSAPTRMLVPAARMEEAKAVAKETAGGITVGDPNGDFTLGPVVSGVQFEKIQGLIQRGIEDGGTLVVGGVGRPEGLDKGYFVKPTIFADVTNDMTIAREEIFGPVLSIIGYEDVEDAINLANDSEYGLAGYVSGADVEECRRVARELRAGSIGINHGFDFCAPFGGYKKSGNGREWGEAGFEEFLEVKSILGYESAS
jgi:aldehyde dehydrogenase (NAD+)